MNEYIKLSNKITIAYLYTRTALLALLVIFTITMNHQSLLRNALVIIIAVYYAFAIIFLVATIILKKKYASIRCLSTIVAVLIALIVKRYIDVNDIASYNNIFVAILIAALVLNAIVLVSRQKSLFVNFLTSQHLAEKLTDYKIESLNTSNIETFCRLHNCQFSCSSKGSIELLNRIATNSLKESVALTKSTATIMPDSHKLLYKPQVSTRMKTDVTSATINYR